METKKYVEFVVESDSLTGINIAKYKKEADTFFKESTDYDIIIFDLTTVDYLDSSGVNFLLNMSKTLKKKIVLKNCSVSVKKLIELLNLDDRFGYINGFNTTS